MYDYVTNHMNRWEKPIQYELRNCPHCEVSAVVPEGQPWNHECQHQMIWITANRVECLGCDWCYDRPRGIDGETVRGLFKAAHTRAS